MARAELAYAARWEVWLASKAAMHDVTMALRKLKGASHESEVGLAVATDDADPEALEDEAFNAAMESVELDGLEGEEAELAAWERAAGALADRMDNNRQTMAGGRPGLEVDLDCVHWTLMPPPTARIPTSTQLLGQRMDAVVAAASGCSIPADVEEEEENRMTGSEMQRECHGIHPGSIFQTCSKLS